MSLQILGLCGSLRVASLNRALMRHVGAAFGDAGQLHTVDIGALPHYNADLDGERKPEAVAELRAAVEQSDALLIVTPEYNYGIPGVLKNALDWASRPAYRSPLAGTPTAMLGASPGAVGTARAQAQLRQILAGTLTPIFPYPEVLVGGAGAKFDERGALVDPRTAEHLERFAKAFLDWTKSTGSGD